VRIRSILKPSPLEEQVKGQSIMTIDPGQSLVRPASRFRARHARTTSGPFGEAYTYLPHPGVDLESDMARPGPIFTERVVAPPSAPIVTSAAGALAVVLNERGHVDINHIAELLHVDADAGGAIYRDPETGTWQTDDANLSGQVGTSSSPPILARRTSPRVSARPGFRPPMSSPSSRRR
jgi:hypothetical protein